MKHHCKIKWHPLSLPGLFLLFFAVSPVRRFAVLSSVLLHEMGHLLMSLLFCKRAKGITVLPFGIGIDLETPDSYIQEIAISVAGPLLNFLYALTAFLLPSGIRGQVQAVSLFLGIFNLLPIRTFDGGHMVRAALSYGMSEKIGDTVLDITTSVFLFILYVISVYIFFESGVNFSLFLFVTYVFSYLAIKKL